MSRALFVAILMLLALRATLAQPPFVTADPEPLHRERVTVASVATGESFVLTDGRRGVLEGIQLPEDEAARKAARERLAALVKGKELTLLRRGERRLIPVSGTGEVQLVHLAIDGETTVSEQLLREGLVLPHFLAEGSRAPSYLESAFQAAKKAKRGLHAGRAVKERPAELAFHRGVSLGLYSRSDAYDYRPFLRQIAALGASHVMLIVPSFMADWQAVTIRPKRYRTASLATVSRVIRQARAVGLRVVCMPIVLLETGTKDHWRGDIQPKSRLTWFRNYGRLLCRWADRCEAEGASTLIVGSEFSSLEAETLQWQSLIRSIRQRFQGSLGYSANWDHLTTIRFWDDLDLVGMTGYHSLTKKDDPTVAELEAAWRPIRAKLLRITKGLGKPFVFTELGYASQDGINRDPWNYFLSETPDPQEQADCYQAFFSVWRENPDYYRGAYFYNWWQNHDPDDRINYSIRGKPAEKIIREAFRDR